MHPGLEHEKTSEMTEEELVKKTTEINKRMGMAYQSGRTEVVRQLQLLLEHYQDALNEKMMMQLQSILDADPKFGRKVIDIDWPDPAEDEDDYDKY